MPPIPFFINLLAAKCTGTAGSGVEQVIDEEFLSSIERHHADCAGANGANSAALDDLSKNLGTRITGVESSLDDARVGIKPLNLLAWLIGLPLALTIGWSLYANYRTEHVLSLANRAVAASPETSAYPIKVDVTQTGKVVTL